MAGGKTQHTQNINLDDAKARFSKALNFALLHKFGRVPTANSLANQFNYRAIGMTGVTRETARKWLCGLAIPEVAKLIVLVDWLGLDANEFMSKRTASVRTDADVVADTISELLKHMDEKNRNVVLITAWALRETEGLKAHKLDLQALRRALMFNLSNENHHLP
jgi:transcriptional regulator with XRE-family HTH domain